MARTQKKLAKPSQLKKQSEQISQIKPPSSTPRMGSSSDIVGFLGIQAYQEKSNEEFMNNNQVAHFKKILELWHENIFAEANKTIDTIKKTSEIHSDPLDTATQDEEFRLTLRARDRERKLLRKIDQALARIHDGSYGFCIETDEPIGLRRLEARPIATMCIEAQEMHERQKRLINREDY
jgi:DnaK suppressor protein